MISKGSQSGIKHLQSRVCKTCVHFRPDWLDFMYSSPLARCSKFGEKHIVSGEVHHTYADICRMDETKCGQVAREFEDDPWVRWKIAKYWGILLSPFLLTGFLSGMMLSRKH